ncbi:MAG: hypothetical protein IPM63_09965 [Acidobacteriota bacterium]|nr:MAG: hypothetical protein IPM63_09965 [Acidobacteriota bacterium]
MSALVKVMNRALRFTRNQQVYIALFLPLAICIWISGCVADPREFEMPSQSKKSVPQTTPIRETMNLGNLVRKDGWLIPIPKDGKKVGKTIVTLEDASGNEIPVVYTSFLPASEVQFILKASKVEERNRLVEGKFLLRGYKEMRTPTGIFGYIIIARRIAPLEPTERISYTNIVFHIVDFDGNGSFETLITDSSRLVVPSWSRFGK